MTNQQFLARDNPWRHWMVGCCLGALLLVGLATYKGYGISYDMDASRTIGMTSLRYVAERVNPEFLTRQTQWAHFANYPAALHEFNDRDYGVGYELPVTLAERLLELSDTRSIYQFRHLCVFLVSYAGVLALFGLGRRRYGGDWRTGLAAAALLVLSPRLFGEFFYNDKDAVFMALCTVATYTTVRFVERPTWGWAGLHALACALAIDVRLMAVLWPLATGALLAGRWAQGEYAPGATGPRAGAVLLYALLLPALVIAQWPYLWQDPWVNFVHAFNNMRHFRWEGAIFYQGHDVYSTDLPWHYVPQWILVTTPLLQLGLLATGLVVLARQLRRRGWRLYGQGTREWQDILALGLGLGPILAVILLQAVLYDGWRQLYFVYPSLLLVALRGLVALAHWLAHRPRGQQRLAGGVLALGLLTSAGQIAWMYPLESLYFNLLAGRHPTSYYEQDYWGISYTEGLAWILAHDSRPKLRICTDYFMSPPLILNTYALPAEEVSRIELVDVPAKADYFIGSYRQHHYPYNMPGTPHDIRAGRQVALTIFNLTSSW